ncbi:hypothetical protein Dsin_025164 [Dipteronia sinensis]|uniref:Uncharacterized protein n=1 Tax=Dipteronia sinensis TaxID=43782 RepID=A0AAD9ZVL3_9ROSI|nr:hypothetical protein Dsin_025164 [Dipteronia sinensis]
MMESTGPSAASVLQPEIPSEASDLEPNIQDSGPPAASVEGYVSDIDNDYEVNEEFNDDADSDVSLVDECREVDDDIHDQLSCDSLTIYRAKKIVLSNLKTDHITSYGKMKKYGNAIIAMNPGKRYCFRHMLANFKSTFKDNMMNGKLWSIARAGSKAIFTERMKSLGEDSMEAVLWLMKEPCDKWARHAFECDTKLDHITNNMLECFNNWIKDEMGKPILTLLKHLRRKIIVRFSDKWDEVEKLKDSITPYARQRLTKNEMNGRKLHGKGVGSTSKRKKTSKKTTTSVAASTSRTQGLNQTGNGGSTDTIYQHFMAPPSNAS